MRSSRSAPRRRPVRTSSSSTPRAKRPSPSAISTTRSIRPSRCRSFAIRRSYATRSSSSTRRTSCPSGRATRSRCRSAETRWSRPSRPARSGAARCTASYASSARRLRARLCETLADAGARPGGDWIPHEPPEAALAELESALGALSLRAARTLAGAPAGPLAPLFTLAFQLHRFVAVAQGREPGFVSLAGFAGEAPALERFCRDPAPALGRLFAGCHALIGCSATLSPPELYAASLGLARERSVHAHIAAEDRSAQRAVVIDAGVTTADAARAREAPRIARRLAALAAAVPGNCLALFPSHAFLERVRAALPPLDRTLRWQARGDGEPERSAVVDELRRRDDLLVFAVAGGGLAEGVDYAGAGLGAVAVVGPCLPAVSTRRALLAEHFEERFDRGFELAYAVPGMIRVVQSAGRLLRTGSDRGVIALYDRRFLREPYRSLLPEEWLAGRTPDDLRGDPAAVARRFFSS